MKLLRKIVRLGRSSTPAETPGRVPSEREYYEDLFVKNPLWNSKTPNADESARWERIRYLLDKYFKVGPGARILDAGCGRGWLTNLLGKYGQPMGIEPIEPVVEHARRLFPEIRFEVNTPAKIAENESFDLVVSSEVLEHVTDKPRFIADLYRLLRPAGLLVVTTPRGELYEQWTETFDKPAQPIEEWISTSELKNLLTATGFQMLESTTAYELGIYQIHACRK